MTCIKIATLSLIAAVTLGCSSQNQSISIEKKAQFIHDKVIVLDTHNDFSNANFVEDKKTPRSCSKQSILMF